jgi:hypothetical protein
MNCELCNEEEAAFTIIPVGEGMPQSLGPACFARAGLELAKQILPAEEIASTLGPMFVTPMTPKDETGAPKRGRAAKTTTKAKAEAVEGEAGGEVEAPAAAANE